MKTSSPNTAELGKTIAALLAPGKGILAADESLPTIGKRFAALGIDNDEDHRRGYRETLFTTPQLGTTISGAILFEETLQQKLSTGVAMPSALAAVGVVPGIKVDAGAVPLPLFADEKITLGLDGLRERLATYRDQGARFTKWRAVIGIGNGFPTPTCIAANAEALALFAALSQEASLVPIVEPEVLMDGDHTLARCEEVTEFTLKAVFSALFAHRVSLEFMLLKSGMVLSGSDCREQATTREVAEATLRCFRRTVPAAVPGIVFLSGGQSETDATDRLNAICSQGGSPWALSFSFGRALQDSAMKAWGGKPDQVQQAQRALLHRAHCNSLALQGKYTEELERT